jgi:hypothetical protein
MLRSLEKALSPRYLRIELLALAVGLYLLSRLKDLPLADWIRQFFQALTR